MRQYAVRAGMNSHGPLKGTAALVASMFAQAAAQNVQAFDYSASDWGTLYQDNFGTLPVTSVEQPVGYMIDRSRGGAQRGSEMVINGTFDAGFTGWTIPVTAPGTAVVSGGRATLDSGSTGTSRLRQNFAITPGWYEMSFEVTSFVGPAANLQVSLGSDTAGGSQYLAMSGIGVLPGVIRRVFYADSTLLGIAFFIASTTTQTTLTIDNFSIKALTGANAWNNTPTVIDANWTNAGGGVFTSNGGTGTLGIANRLVIGRTYEAVLRVTARSAGTLNLPYDGTGGNVSSVNAVGVYRRIFTATATAVFIYSNAFNGTADFIGVREIPGNHLQQPTSTSRPILSARVNWLPTSDIGSASYAHSGTKTTGQPDSQGGTTAVRLTGPTSGPSTITMAAPAASILYEIDILLEPAATVPGSASFLIRNTTTSTNLGGATFNIVTGSMGGSGTATNLGNNWYRIRIAQTTGITAGDSLALYYGFTSATASAFSFVVGRPQVSVGPDPVRYQRVTSSTDYDSAGYARGLRHDGSDDGLYSLNNVDFSGSNRLTLTAAVLKTADSAAGGSAIFELSPTVASNDGSFGLYGSWSTLASAPGVAGSSRGTARADAINAGTTPPTRAPYTGVLAMRADIAAPSVDVFASGAPLVSTLSTQGTGNYGSYALNLGRRNNATIPFAGIIYSVRGIARRASPDEFGWMHTLGKQEMTSV